MILLCSALTPYYNEDVMYSKAQLEDKNVDGITILYYLQTIVPGYLTSSMWDQLI